MTAVGETLLFLTLRNSSAVGGESCEFRLSRVDFDGFSHWAARRDILSNYNLSLHEVGWSISGGYGGRRGCGALTGLTFPDRCNKITWRTRHDNRDGQTQGAGYSIRAIRDCLHQPGGLLLSLRVLDWGRW